MQSAAGGALGEREVIESVQLLIHALSDASTDVPAAAALALGNQGDAKAIGPLIAALKDSDNDVTYCVLKSLSIFKDKQTNVTTLPFLSHPNENHRAKAA